MQYIVRCLVLSFTLAGCHGRPGPLAGTDGILPPCPPSPNCVSTEASDDRHRIAPIPFTDAPGEAQARARRALEAEARTKVVQEAPGYLRAEATSLLFRFVDDVEVVVDTSGKFFRLRSASRLGRGDLGVNRARMTRVGDRLRQ
jgi:uncharacterized protein (DUF1499 family)